MKLATGIALLLVCFAASIQQVSAEYEEQLIANSMYSFLPNAHACTRWLNNNGQIGCSTSMAGNNAELALLYDQASLEAFVKAPPTHKPIAVIPSLYFRPETLSALNDTIAGLIVLETEIKPPPGLGFSPDMPYPQQSLSIPAGANYTWNAKGNGMMFNSWDIPIFVLNKNDSQTVLQCGKENKENTNSWKWGAELSAFMWASQDSATCLRRKHCEPVGGHSVLSPFPGKFGDFSQFIFSLANFDGNALFYQRSIGAESEMSGTIANLIALKAISTVPRNLFQKQIIFAFLDGENWGYVGSNRLIHDLTGGFVCEELASNNISCAKPNYPSLDFLKIPFQGLTDIVEVKQVGKTQANGGTPGNF